MNPLDVSCPECKVAKRATCVYTTPKAPRTHSSEWQWRRVGLPTKRSHNGRFQKAWYLAKAEERRAQHEALRESPERASALRANADAVAAEQHQLIAWLRQHAHILTT